MLLCQGKKGGKAVKPPHKALPEPHQIQKNRVTSTNPNGIIPWSHMKSQKSQKKCKANRNPRVLPHFCCWFQVRADGLHRAAARGDAEAGESTWRNEGDLVTKKSIAKNEDLGKSVWKITIEIVEHHHRNSGLIHMDLPSYKMVLSHDLYLVGGDWNMAGLWLAIQLGMSSGPNWLQ